MDQVPAVVSEDVQTEEQSSIDVAPSTAVDVSSAKSDAPSSEDIADSDRPTSSQEFGLYCCQDCGEAFGEEATLLDHRIQHPNGKCAMYLEPMDDSDMAEKDEESTSSCQLCTLSFADMSEFRSHMETHRVQSSDTQQISGSPKQNFFECSECGKRYSMLGHFLNHQRTHIEASKSLFNDLEQLQKKSFQCETCGRNYSRASALDAHRRCHEEKLFKRQYRTSGHRTDTDEQPAAKLSKKEPSGTSEKLFQCACGKSFPALMHLKTHQRFSHNIDCFPKERTEKLRKNVFYCRECQKAFHGHLAWFNHEKWHENHSKDSPNRFPCEACGKVFMTQTFYYRHQRMVHSGETPAKSFLHQVDQLQKKAFECIDCGLRFSRLSALQSHQLHHTSSFTETEKSVQEHSPLLHHQETLEGELKVTRQLRHHVLAEDVLDIESEDHPDVNEPGDDVMESYEPGDFNVMVISASESDDEAVQDLSPNFDSGSDQEGHGNNSVSHLVSKPELDLKIVQVDFDPAKEQSPPAAENNETKEQFDCPECYRCFFSEASLRAHLGWHNIHKKSLQTKGQSVEVYTCDNEAHNFAAGATPEYKHETNHELKQAGLFEQKTVTCDTCGTKLSHLSDEHDERLLCRDCETSSLLNHKRTRATKSTESISPSAKVYNPKKTLLGPKIYHCEQCGKGFWSLGAYSHHKQSPSLCVDVRLRTGVTQPLHRGRPRSSMKVACPVCGRKFRHKGIMTLHMRTHENGNHQCEVCNRTFRLFSSLLRHQVVHSELLPPPSKSFQHQVEQLQKNTYSCPDCGKLFSRAKALQFHMRYHGNESGQSPSPPRSCVRQEDFQCATCLKHLSNKVSLRAHRKLCVKKKQHIMECHTKNLNNNESVNSEESAVQVPHNFKKEMEAVDMESPNTVCGFENTSDLRYKCNKCERSFSVVGALNLHKRIHAKGYSKKGAKATLYLLTSEEELRKDDQFPCSECGKRFLSNSALGSHKRWHTNDKLSSLKEQLPDRCLQQDCQSSTLQLQPDMRPKSETSEGHQTCVRGPFSDEHSNTLEARDTQTGDSSLSAINRVMNECESISTIPTARNYQCPLCLASFSKVRGLRAHTWQAHSKSRQAKPKSELDAQIPSVATSCEIKCENVATEISKDPFSKIDASPWSVPNLECGLQCEAAAIIPDHKLCLGSKLVVQAPDPLGEASPLISRLSEPIVKCLFKCGKCGKAFPTEGQLETHKTKAKSRPFCCALCCNAFLTESQLQQHLAWHDEVRFRLPNEVRLRLSAALNTKSVRATGKSFPPHEPKQQAVKQESQSVISNLHGDKAFLSSSKFSNHKCLHCQTAACDCPRASVTVDDLRALSKHDRAATGDSRWQSDSPAADVLTCLECGATFSQETDLHQHYTKHAQSMY
ncbi:zinc finger protein 721 isoform X1 [Hippocampus comes]|uniref:zinc finger protein 721 isoform X1 n=1 Tax=Hippocampus comes TaxID=109280 RepID=UPI00094E8B60|nr:PREDICTED: zinc finger protein 721-like isoform X1 [Hippocampus comes]